VIGHQAVGNDPHGPGEQRLGDHSFEGRKIALLQEQAHAPNASIQNVE
jgi:hypothetical protein